MIVWIKTFGKLKKQNPAVITSSMSAADEIAPFHVKGVTWVIKPGRKTPLFTAAAKLLASFSIMFWVKSNPAPLARSHLAACRHLRGT